MIKWTPFFLSTATGHKITARIIDDLLACLFLLCDFFSLLKTTDQKTQEGVEEYLNVNY